MSFTFHGLFTTAGADVLGACLRAFPAAQGRLTTQPFEGAALRWTEPPPPDWLQVDFPALAQQHPDAVFVYIHAAPVGDTTGYAGVVLKGNQVLLRRVLTDAPAGVAAATPAPTRSITGKPLPASATNPLPAPGLPADFPHALAALVAPLGVQLRTGYFAPFSLRFWNP